MNYNFIRTGLETCCLSVVPYINLITLNDVIQQLQFKLIKFKTPGFIKYFLQRPGR